MSIQAPPFTPTKGRSVLYVLQNGETRPATVSNAFPFATVANLTVHLDQMNDLGKDGHCRPDLIPQGALAITPGTLAVGSAKHNPTAKEPGTYHVHTDRAAGLL